MTTSLANGNGTFQAPSTFYLDAGDATTCSVAAADMNADGKADLVVAIPGDNRILVFLGNGDGTISVPDHVWYPDAPRRILLPQYRCS